MTKRRILFVADGHAVHTHEWLRLLEGTDWDVHVSVGGAVPPCRINAVFHTLDTKAPNPAGNAVRPVWPWRRGLSRYYRLRFGHGPAAESRRLAALVRKLRPTIVHSLRLQHEGYTTLGALPAVRKVGASWLVSLWGSDLAYFEEIEAHHERIYSVLTSCDYLTADCRRDLTLARRFGAVPEQLWFDHPIPGNGGLDLEAIERRVVEPDPGARRVILFPKARGDRFHRFIPIVEALAMLEDVAARFELVFLGVDEASRRALDELPASIRRRCDVRGQIARDDVLDLMGRARVMIAPSISDGTPNVMLEAMAAGALPILSPLESIEEWIEDGVNGLLVGNDHVPGLIEAIRRACADDELVREAADANHRIVAAWADRKRVRANVLSMYDAIASGATMPRRSEEIAAPVHHSRVGHRSGTSTVARDDTVVMAGRPGNGNGVV